MAEQENKTVNKQQVLHDLLEFGKKSILLTSHDADVSRDCRVALHGRCQILVGKHHLAMHVGEEHPHRRYSIYSSRIAECSLLGHHRIDTLIQRIGAIDI